MKSDGCELQSLALQSVRRSERCSPTWTSALGRSDDLIDSSRGTVISPGPVVNPLGTTEREGREGERKRKEQWMEKKEESILVQIKLYLCGTSHGWKKRKIKVLENILKQIKNKAFNCIWLKCQPSSHTYIDYCPSNLKQSVTLAEHKWTKREDGHPGEKEIKDREKKK